MSRHDSQWGARFFNEYRSVVAGSPERRPSDTQLVSIVHGCVRPSLWLVADVIIREKNLRPATFHDALDIMVDAERRSDHQDPQVTFANQLRAIPQPLVPLSPVLSAPSPSSATNPMMASQCSCSDPEPIAIACHS